MEPTLFLGNIKSKEQQQYQWNQAVDKKALTLSHFSENLRGTAAFSIYVWNVKLLFKS